VSDHTPGPWELSYLTVKTDDGFYVADCDKSLLIPPAQMLANARLIAAAPDLLEALEMCVKVAGRKTVEFDAARAAIAKAKGGAL